MKTNNIRKVIVWSTDVFRLIEGEPIGGIAVQLFFWAQTFASQGWAVFSFIENGKESYTRERITFKPKRNIQRINALLEWWYAIKMILIERPHLIIYRGANRELLPLSVITKLFGVKLVFFAASDVNFEPGKELVGSESNRRMYQRSIKKIKYFVVQNEHQHETLLKNYGKESLILFNIWGSTHFDGQNVPPTSDAVWVANFRRLKRAEWVLDAAKMFPDFRFAMAGSEANDVPYYNKMKDRASVLDNVDFLGGRSFFYINELVSKSRVLLCTSTFEGFPNTFLQAWSCGLPVITTVDPSGIIQKNNLGVVVETEDDLNKALQKMLIEKEYYQNKRLSVISFFSNNYVSEQSYNKLIELFL